MIKTSTTLAALACLGNMLGASAAPNPDGILSRVMRAGETDAPTHAPTFAPTFVPSMSPTLVPYERATLPYSTSNIEYDAGDEFVWHGSDVQDYYDGPLKTAVENANTAQEKLQTAMENDEKRDIWRWSTVLAEELNRKWHYEMFLIHTIAPAVGDDCVGCPTYLSGVTPSDKCILAGCPKPETENLTLAFNHYFGSLDDFETALEQSRLAPDHPDDTFSHLVVEKSFQEAPPDACGMKIVTTKPTDNIATRHGPNFDSLAGIDWNTANYTSLINRSNPYWGLFNWGNIAQNAEMPSPGMQQVSSSGY